MKNVWLEMKLILIAVMCVAALTACGSESDSSSTTTTAATPVATGPVEVQLPAGVISAQNSIVSWIDLENLSEDSLNESVDAVIGVLGEEDQVQARKEFDEQKADFAKAFDAKRKMVAAGARAMVMAGSMGTSGDESDMGPEPEPAAAAEGTDEPTQQVLFLIRPGTSPQQAILDMAVTMQEIGDAKRERDAAAGEEVEPPADVFDPSKVAFVEIDDQWLALVGPDSAGPIKQGEAALDVAKYTEALKREDGSVARLAWVMTDEAKADLREQMTSGMGAMFLGGVLGPMQQMQDATGGVWLGKEPKLKMAFNFDSTASSQQFKSGVDGLVMMVGGMMSMANDGSPEAAEDAKKMQTVLALLLLDMNGETVSKTFDIPMVKKMAEAGIPLMGSGDEEDEEETDAAESPAR